MLTHVRIGPLRLLPLTDLMDLGHINVLCGKNNSGKSTVLQALVTAELADDGILLNDERIEALQKVLRSQPPFAPHPDSHSYVIAAKRILRDIRDEKFPRVIFRSQMGDYLDEVVDRFKQDQHLRNFGPPTTSLHQTLEGFFGKKRTVALIPPKRLLETSSNINMNLEVTTGTSLVAYLFYAANQRETDEARKVYEEIRAAFGEISGGFEFRIEPQRTNQIALFVRAPRDARWVPAQDAGLGLQDLIVLLYHAIHSGPDLVLIEEPENHLHPDMQRRLLHLLRSRSEKQFFLSTHSSIFVSGILVDRIFYTALGDSITASEVTSRAHVLENLGYSVTDNLVSDLVILVEGPKDRPFIEEYLDKLGLLAKYDIRIWPLGGDIMHEHDLRVFAERYNVIALIVNFPRFNGHRV